MNKASYKNMYHILKQQTKVLRNQLSPNSESDKKNEIPENFNQIGWDITIEKIEALLEKMKQLRAAKGRRLTPQFYRSIYNRALIGAKEIDTLLETLATSESDDFDYEGECVILTAEIHSLNIQVAEIAKKAEEDAKIEADKQAAEEAKQAAETEAQKQSGKSK